MTVFALFIFLMMLMVAGMGVDLMHYESTRTKLQEVCDRGVLAAADLQQTLNPRDVVRDHFARAGLSAQVRSVRVTNTFNQRTVSATAEMEVDTFFMHLVGVDELRAPAACEAQESVSDVEIVLVLDVSGSMNQNNRLRNLQNAATEFVQMVREGDDENRVSIAIVPFNGQVNLGPTLFAQYALLDRHSGTNSHCVDEPASIFSSPGIPTTLPMPQAGHYDFESGTDMRGPPRFVAPEPVETRPGRNPFLTCRVDRRSFVHLPAQDVAGLQTYVRDLRADGSTSITRGMKWGLALLDPGARPMFDRLTTAGHMPATLRGRPFDYNQTNTLKVIVLMTDGEHMAAPQYRPGYAATPSPVWQADGGIENERFSMFHERGETPYEFWVPPLNTAPPRAPPPPGGAARPGAPPPQGVPHDGVPGGWRCAPWDGTVDADCDGDGPDTDSDGLGTVRRLTWAELWAGARMNWVAWQLHARARCPPTDAGPDRTCRTDAFNAFRAQVGRDRPLIFVDDVDAMNGTLQQSCDLARANRVVVYGIAFEAPPRGRTQIQNCIHGVDERGVTKSENPNHYFFVPASGEGLDLREVFELIAGQIITLRLSQ